MAAVGARMARRLRVLGAVELFNAGFLPAVLLYLLPVTAGVVAAVVATGAVLVVGSAYWFARAVRVERRLGRTPALAGFVVARHVLLAVLGVTFAVVAGDVVTGTGAGRWVGVAIWLFAVAEHVNYFRVQLGYQNGPDLRRLLRRRRPAPAHLGRDLRRGR